MAHVYHYTNKRCKSLFTISRIEALFYFPGLPDFRPAVKHMTQFPPIH